MNNKKSRRGKPSYVCRIDGDKLVVEISGLDVEMLRREADARNETITWKVDLVQEVESGAVGAAENAVQSLIEYIESWRPRSPAELADDCLESATQLDLCFDGGDEALLLESLEEYIAEEKLSGDGVVALRDGVKLALLGQFTDARASFANACKLLDWSVE